MDLETYKKMLKDRIEVLDDSAKSLLRKKLYESASLYISRINELRFCLKEAENIE